MHTRLRLVIFGTFLSISFVLNERVRTNLFFYQWLVIAYSYKRYRTTSLNERKRIDKSHHRLKSHAAFLFFVFFLKFIPRYSLQDVDYL